MRRSARPSWTTKVAAAAFRRLIEHLRLRRDVQNIDLIGDAGFCRNCLADWVSEASGGALDRDQAREAIYGMPFADWKAQYQQPATPEQLARMEASLPINAKARDDTSSPRLAEGAVQASEADGSAAIGILTLNALPMFGPALSTSIVPP